MGKIKANLTGLKSKTAFQREPVNREFVKSVRTESASKTIGKIKPGFEMFGFTKGQFSCIDVIEHCLEQTGPADVFISTWSAATADIQAAHRFLTNGKIRDLKFLVDFSFQSRKPEFCKELVATFGYDSIRVTVIHAKTVLITNEKWNLVIRTSMNLNFNPRFENFEISESKPFADFMKEIISEIWSSQKAAEGFEIRPADNQKNFKRTFQQQSGLFEGLMDARDLT